LHASSRRRADAVPTQKDAKGPLPAT
jgi:hypothetical protein